MEFLEKMTRKQRQRALQLSLGFGMILLVVLVELVAIEDAGIYSFTEGKYKTFIIGAPRHRVLAEVNRFKAIRRIRTCRPDSLEELKKRRHFTMTDSLSTSSIWICRFKNGNQLMFLFREGELSRILLLKSRFNREIRSQLFAGCPKDMDEVDAFLKNQAEHEVFYR